MMLLAICSILSILVVIAGAWFYYARTNRLVRKLKLIVDETFLRIETRLERGAPDFETVHAPELTWAMMTTFDRKEITEQTIRSLRQHEPALPLLVVDNGSTDGTREMLITLHREGLIQKLLLNHHNEVPQWQKTFAVSQGMKLLSMERPAYYVWMDDDLIVQRPFVKQAIEILRELRDKNVKVVNMTDDDVEERNHPTIERVAVKSLPGEVKLRRTFNGQFDLFSVELLKEFGYPPVAEGINEWGSEDWYYSRRLVSRDYRVAVFEAAKHLGSASSKREKIERDHLAIPRA